MPARPLRWSLGFALLAVWVVSFCEALDTTISHLRSRFSDANKTARLAGGVLLMVVILPVLLPPTTQAQASGAGGQAPPTMNIPPEIQAISRKMKSGQKPTQEEMKKLQDWANGIAHQPGAHPYCVAGSTSASLQPPTAAQYQALVVRVRQAYAVKAGSGRRWVDSALAKNSAKTAIANLGPALLLRSAGTAAAYALALAAQRFPSDAAIASNLGAALHTTGDDKDAIQVLLYSNALAPKMPTTLTSLGWTLYSLHDTTDAQKYFNSAVGLAAGLGMAQLGLGLIAECQGKSLDAVAYLRRATRGGASLLQQNIALSDAKSDIQAQQDQAQQAAQENNSSSNTSASAAGPIGSISDLVPSTPSNSIPMPNFPDAFMPQTEAMAEQLVAAYKAQADAFAQAMMQDSKAVVQALHGRDIQISPTKTIIYLNPSGSWYRQTEIVDYYDAKFSQDQANLKPGIATAQEAGNRDTQQMYVDVHRLEQQIAGSTKQQFDHIQAETKRTLACKTLSRDADTYSAFVPYFNRFKPGKKADLIQFYKDAYQNISQTPDATIRLDEFLEMQHRLATAHMGDFGGYGIWRFELNYKELEAECGNSETPSAQTPPPQVSVTEPEGKCGIPGQLKIDLGVLNTTVSCKEIEFELAVEEFAGSLKIEREGSVTIFFGVSSEALLGSQVSGKAGIYATFDGLGPSGQITDLGVSAEANAGGVKLTETLSVAAGPKFNPNYEGKVGP